MRVLIRVLPFACAAIMAVAAAGCGKTVEEYVAEGKRYIEKGQYAEATVVLRRAVEENPDSGEARFQLAEAYFKSNDMQRAAIEFINAGALLPQNLEAQLRAGEMMLLGRKFEEAQTMARRSLILDPRSIRALVLNANALAGMKRHDQAMAAIERAIQLDPTRADTLGDLAMLQMHATSAEEAEKTFKRMIDLDPRSVQNHVTLGSFYWVTGRLADAETEFLTAYKLQPEHIAANRALATFYIGTNRLRQAEQYLRVAVGGMATTAAELALADYYLSLNRIADAEQVLDKVAKKADGFGEARSRLAVIKYAKDPAEAHALIDATLRQDPSNARALLTKAGFLLAENRNDEAFERATAAVNAEPTSLPAHYMLGQILREAGDLQAAQIQYEEILRIQPASIAAQMELAALHMARGDSRAAVEAAERAVKSRPEHIETRAILLRSLITSGDVERATQLLDSMLREAGGRADLHWMAGLLELRKDNRRAARARFERAHALNPNAVEPIDGLVALDLADRRPAAARARVEAAIAAQPRYPALLVLAGRLYGNIGDYAAAERVLKSAIGIDVNFYAAFEELARVYQVSGQLDRGQTEIEAMARRFPRSAGPAMTLGSLMELKGRPIEAQAWFEKALAADPQNAIVANNLAWLYADQGGDLDEALRLALLARKQLAQRSDVADTLGWVYYKRNEISLALPMLKQAVDQAPDNPLFQYHLGLAYAKVGDTPRARDALNRALGRKVEFQGIANARAVLATLQ